MTFAHAAEHRGASPPPDAAAPLAAAVLRVRGTVQGVGFRPTVWRIARELGVLGSVCNDAHGVLIEAVAPAAVLDRLARRIRSDAPPLARIERLERLPAALPATLPAGFVIGDSRAGPARTAVAADAATCMACVAEMLDPGARRYRYPLSNCTHCGPRLSIVTGVPYDRAATTMAGFTMCPACAAEYADPADRRFHAQPIACPACGPRVRLLDLDGGDFPVAAGAAEDACDAAGALLDAGEIVAIKGLGGYQLACDATSAEAVARLRALKHREAKPFALMAASLAAVRAWCEVDDTEAAALLAPAAPIVLLRRRADAGDGGPVAGVAPDLGLLGFMLPSTGLHHLVLQRMRRPVVLTSGNLSDEPQAITRDELKARFPQGIAAVLDHDRAIARRVDDSVQRVVDGEPRLLRRARGHAPEPIVLPAGFDAAPAVLAHGSELKNTFCLLRDGRAVLSPHRGDLADAATLADTRRSLHELQRFFAFEPRLQACDAHPDYLSTQAAHATGATVVPVLHHHAHVAACLADNGWPLDGGAVIGVALDGLGLGADGELWGGEFALVDYTRFERRGSLQAIALPGGEQAMHEPWRNTYAHLVAAFGWDGFAARWPGLELHGFLAARPRALLDTMIARRINSPPASSCGRLFDAVAAALGLCRERTAYEGQAAVRLEAAVDRDWLAQAGAADGLPFALVPAAADGVARLDPRPMWAELLDELARGTPVARIAARLHLGLAQAVSTMVRHVAATPGAGTRTVALSGGVFQNAVLATETGRALRDAGFTVLAHRRVPCNDGGLALGQAAVAAARALAAG